MNDPFDSIEKPSIIPSLVDSSAIPVFMNYVIYQLEVLNDKLNAIHIDNANHRSETSKIKKDVEEIKEAFPKDEGGIVDFDGHHDYHWKLVEASKSWHEIWVDVRKKVFGGVAWAVIVFIGYSIWEELKRRVREGQ